MIEKINEFSERLLVLPNEISDLQEELIELTDESQKIQNEVSERASELKTLISNTLDDNGKKLYSNAESRDAAFITESKDDDILPGLYSKQDIIQKKIQKVKIGIENLSNYQKNLRILINYMSTNTDNY